MKVFHLKFNKETDGCWYIDFPGYPFDHHNLMMVAGADMLCEYVAEKEGHPGYAVVDVTTGDKLVDDRTPDKMEDGLPPFVKRDGQLLLITEAWICPVTLLVLGRYPKQINIYLK